MQPRKHQSRRFFSRNGRTPHHGSDRRHASGQPYFGWDRRQTRADSARSSPPAQPPREPRQNPPILPAAIARRAEELYRASGCLPGRDLDNWLAAEQALQREARQVAGDRYQKALIQWQHMLEENGVSQAEAMDERLWLSRLLDHG